MCNMRIRRVIDIFCVIGFFVIALSTDNVEATAEPLWNETLTDILRNDLLKNYDKFARPVQHFNTTSVQFGLEVYYVNIDEFQSMVNIKAYVRVAWNDEKMKWNASNYGNIQVLHMANHEIWQPDITVMNSVGSSSIENYGDTPFLIYPNGDILYVARSQFHIVCDLDLRLWPFDTQKCDLEVGSWAYSGEQIKLTFYAHGAADIEQSEHAAWKITETIPLVHASAQGCCTEDPHDTLVFIFTIKRNSVLYTSVFVTPTIFIVILNLVIFWLPPQSKEKLTLCSLTAVLVCLFLIYFTHKIPSTAKTPLIVSFYSGCLCQLTMSLVISAIVMNMSVITHNKPVPQVFRDILMGKTGRYLGLCDHIDSLKTGQDEWTMLATALDRISFLFFSFVFSIMGIIYMS